MGWEAAVSRKGNDKIFKVAWKKAQKLRARVEKMLEHFFEELVYIGVDVEDAPNLGKFTPSWEPLSEDWAARKGHDSFYYDTGALERALLRKSTTAIFGRPQVFLEWDGHSVKVNAGQAAKKYAGKPLNKLSVRVVPFPKLTSEWSAESLVADPGSETFFKINPARKGSLGRPLVTPFVNWYTHVRIRDAMKGFT